VQADRRKLIFGGGVYLGCFFARRFIQKEVGLGKREPGQFDVVELELEEPLELCCQQLAVPTGKFGQTIIGDHVGAPLGWRETGQPNGRNLP
jgi:hypothetical protein